MFQRTTYQILIIIAQGSNYWDKSYKRGFEQMHSFKIEEGRMQDLARKVGFWDRGKLEIVCNQLREGASIDYIVRGKIPIEKANSKKIYLYGDRIDDAL